ncbi:unnamed protein product, partial [Allacma fusca]
MLNRFTVLFVFGLQVLSYHQVFGNAEAKILSVQDQNDLLDKWKAPKEIRDKFPYYVSGFDIEKRPVFIFEFGKWPLRQFVEKGGEDFENLDTHFQQFFRRVEIGPRAFFNASEIGADGSVFIVDWDGFSPTQFIHAPTLQYSLKNFGTFQRIQDSFAYGFFLNVNAAASQFISLIKPLLGSQIKVYEATGVFPDKDSQPQHLHEENEISDVGLAFSDDNIEPAQRNVSPKRDVTRSQTVEYTLEKSKAKKFCETQSKLTHEEKSPESQVDIWGPKTSASRLNPNIPSSLSLMPLLTWGGTHEQFSRCQNRECLNNKTETETDTSLAKLIVMSPGELRSRLLNGYLRPSGCRLCGRGANLRYEYVDPTVTPPFIVYSCNGLFKNTCPDGKLRWRNEAPESELYLQQDVVSG